MAWTIESALQTKHVENAKVLVNEYRFSPGDLATEVTIKIYRSLDNGQFVIVQSHHIHTPTQGSPYRSSINAYDEEAYALHQAVTGITQYYDEAVNAGNEPDEEWLVPNKYF